MVDEGLFAAAAGEHDWIGRRLGRFELVGVLGGEESVDEAEVDGGAGIHPGFGVHEFGEFGAAEPGLGLVGVDDGFLDRLQHVECPFEFGPVPEAWGTHVGSPWVGANAPAWASGSMLPLIR